MRQQELSGAKTVVSTALGTQREMTKSYIIEVDTQTAGIVVGTPEGFRFFASSHRFNSLEGQLFRNAREAERAARRLIGNVEQAA